MHKPRKDKVIRSTKHNNKTTKRTKHEQKKQQKKNKKKKTQKTKEQKKTTKKQKKKTNKKKNKQAATRSHKEQTTLQPFNCHTIKTDAIVHCTLYCNSATQHTKEGNNYISASIIIIIHYLVSGRFKQTANTDCSFTMANSISSLSS